MNSLTLIGNVTRDAEARTANDKEMSTFGIAVPRRKRDEADFFRVTVFGQLAKISNQFVKKGMKVYVRGCITIRPYQKSDGTTGQSVDVLAEDLELLTRVDSESTQEKAPVSQQPPMLTPEENQNGDLPF